MNEQKKPAPEPSELPDQPPRFAPEKPKPEPSPEELPDQPPR